MFYFSIVSTSILLLLSKVVIKSLDILDKILAGLDTGSLGEDATPEEIINNPQSHTAIYLKQELKPLN